MTRQVVSDVPIDERDRLDAEIKGAMIVTKPLGVRPVGHMAVESLYEAAERGDDSAKTIIQGLASDGIRPHIQRVLAAEVCTVTLHSGETIELPTYVAVPRKRIVTDDEPQYVQRALFYAMGWDEFFAMVAERQKQVEQMTADIEIFRTVGKLRDRYPTSHNALEAAELAGIDLADFRLTDIDRAVS